MYHAAKTVHYYTTDDSWVTRTMQEGVYAFNGVAALLFPTAEVSTRFPSTVTSYFFTASDTERFNALTTGGYSDCGITGYIYPTQVCRPPTLVIPQYQINSE
ncbi:hypothetical protein K438DRAFT_1587903 [Mycena galopus ATCC 62051]|nr:hypothetical protein K438DRAFT_1587903 [Mycena galopus ATCC 62051]